MLKVKKDIIKLFKDNPYVITLYLNEYNKLLLIYNYAMVDTTRLQRDIIPILLKENILNWQKSIQVILPKIFICLFVIDIRTCTIT